MSTLHGGGRSIALVGNPNCGKTALFNLLAGARQHVANYAGVTVERKIGHMRLRHGGVANVIDLPGAYSLTPSSADEQVMVDVLEGRRSGEAAPDLLVVVVDATNLRMNLRLVLELRQYGMPMVLALNMADVARAQGLHIDRACLARELGCAVVETVAVQRNGHRALLDTLEPMLATLPPTTQRPLPGARVDPGVLQQEVRRILALAAPGQPPRRAALQYRLDALAMHPVLGPLVLAAVLFLVFQAVFSWAERPMELIRQSIAWLGDGLLRHMESGPLRSLLVDGVLAGVGSVLV